MHIGEIGGKFDSTTSIDYLSDRTFIEFDALIINYKSVLSGVKRDNKSSYIKRKESLSEFLKYKEAPLTIFAPLNQRFYFDGFPQGEHVGVSYFLPIPSFEVTNETGQIIDVLPKTLFTDFLNKYKSYFHYNSVFTKWQGKITAQTPHTNKVLAYYNEESVFLPQLKETIKNLEGEFLKDLIEVLKKVRRQNEVTQLPQWANDYYLPNEKLLKVEIADTLKQIEDYQTKLTEKQLSLKRYENKKVIFTGTGNELEREVECIFKEIGFEIIEADRNRDDLIVKFGDRVAVVEIKGVNNSAAEKHAAQLEKWVSSYFELNEVKPKGILLVNTFRESEIPNRIEKSFPDQMLKFSVQREHCLITSLQFLGLYYEIHKDSSKKEKLIDSLFETVGVYIEFQNWNDYITYNQLKS